MSPSPREPDQGALERDPILGLIDRFLDARGAYCSDAVSDDESDAFDESTLTPAERALLAGRPTTHDGIVALLKLAVEDHKRDSGGLTTELVENVYAALSGGSVTVSIEPLGASKAPDDKPEPTLDTAPAESEPTGDDRIRELIDEDFETDRALSPFARKHDNELTAAERKRHDVLLARSREIPADIAATSASTLAGIERKIAHLLASIQIGASPNDVDLVRGIGCDLARTTGETFHELREFRPASSLDELIERLGALNAEFDVIPQNDVPEMLRGLDRVTYAAADIVEWRCETPAEMAKQFAVFREYEHMVFDSSRAMLFANLTETLEVCATAEGGAS